MGSDRAAPDASSELVQLRQPQTFRVLDNHQAGIRYVDPDLNDRGGDQQVQFALLEGLHNRLFICRSLVEGGQLVRPGGVLVGFHPLSNRFSSRTNSVGVCTGISQGLDLQGLKNTLGCGT